MKDGPHAMLFYDGESWNPVTLPEELTQATGGPLAHSPWQLPQTAFSLHFRMSQILGVPGCISCC